jgi:hypothetical protein
MDMFHFFMQFLKSNLDLKLLEVIHVPALKSPVAIHLYFYLPGLKSLWSVQEGEIVGPLPLLHEVIHGIFFVPSMYNPK